MAATRNDVARLAGVSPAVVSYVLNNGPRPVSAGARERVLNAVDSLGYTPDARARSLRVRRSDTIGLVVPDATNPFFAELARAVEEASYDKGRAVLISSTANDEAREDSYVHRLAERRVDGLILVSAREDQDLSGLEKLSIPVVALDRAPDASPVSTIRADTVAATYEATRHLVEHGYDRVDFVGGPPIGVSNERREGWLQALEHGGRSGREWESAFSYEGGASVGRAITARAVVAASDVQALGMLSSLHTRGLRVPDDVAVVSIDGTVAARYSVPALTSVAQPIREMGIRAVEHLLQPKTSLLHLTLDSELVVGASCGCNPD